MWDLLIQSRFVVIFISKNIFHLIYQNNAMWLIYCACIIHFSAFTIFIRLNENYLNNILFRVRKTYSFSVAITVRHYQLIARFGVLDFPIIASFHLLMLDKFYQRTAS